MLRYIMYVIFAMMLGVVVMLLPLVILSYQGARSFTSWGEEGMTGSIVSKKILNYTSVQEYRRLSTSFASSLPYAMFIVAVGLASATAVLLMVKRRLL